MESNLRKYYTLQKNFFLIKGLLFLKDKIFVPKILRFELSLILVSHLGMKNAKIELGNDVLTWSLKTLKMLCKTVRCK